MRSSQSRAARRQSRTRTRMGGCHHHGSAQTHALAAHGRHASVWVAATVTEVHHGRARVPGPSRRRRASRPSRGRAPRAGRARRARRRASSASSSSTASRPAGGSSSVPISSQLRRSSSLPSWRVSQWLRCVTISSSARCGGIRGRGHRLRGARRRPPAVEVRCDSVRGEGSAATADGPSPRQDRARRRRAACRRDPASRNAAARVGPPSSSSDWTPSAASAAQLLRERPAPQLEVEPVGQRPPREKTSRRGWPRRRLDVARVEPRPVGARRAAADGDRVDGGAQLVHEPAALLARSPSARPGTVDAPVERRPPTL